MENQKKYLRNYSIDHILNNVKFEKSVPHLSWKNYINYFSDYSITIGNLDLTIPINNRESTTSPSIIGKYVTDNKF